MLSDAHSDYSKNAQGPSVGWKRLPWYYLLLYFLDVKLRDWLKADSWAEIIADYTDPQMLALQITGLLAFGSMTFLTYWMMVGFYDRAPGWGMILLVIAAGCLGILIRFGLEEGLLKWITGTGNYNPETTWSYYFRDNSLYAITYCGLGLVFFLVRYAGFQIKLREQSELRRREAELKFLRSQVNPHFLFNTLNNLYSMVNRGSEKALPTLEKLSGLLRYSLYEQQGFVPIQREIDYLKDLVHLETLRVENLTPVVFDVGVFPPDQQLPPLLLVPFVENAFKHGDLKGGGAPLKINLQPLPGGGIDFSVSNRVNQGQRSKDGVGGIGVLNVKKRLSLLFPGQHQLNIQVENHFYTVELQIHV